jgi:hypothetical protein
MPAETGPKRALLVGDVLHICASIGDIYGRTKKHIVGNDRHRTAFGYAETRWINALEVRSEA